MFYQWHISEGRASTGLQSHGTDWSVQLTIVTGHRDSTKTSSVFEPWERSKTWTCSRLVAHVSSMIFTFSAPSGGSLMNSLLGQGLPRAFDRAGVLSDPTTSVALPAFIKSESTYSLIEWRQYLEFQATSTRASQSATISNTKYWRILGTWCKP